MTKDEREQAVHDWLDCECLYCRDEEPSVMPKCALYEPCMQALASEERNL